MVFLNRNDLIDVYKIDPKEELVTHWDYFYLINNKGEKLKIKKMNLMG